MVREAAEREMTDRERIAALENTLESLSEDSEVAHVLLGLSGALAQVRTVTETLDKGVRIARELFGADRGIGCRATIGVMALANNHCFETWMDLECR